jgi:hypothetical protein
MVCLAPSWCDVRDSGGRPPNIGSAWTPRPVSERLSTRCGSILGTRHVDRFSTNAFRRAEPDLDVGGRRERLTRTSQINKHDGTVPDPMVSRPAAVYAGEGSDLAGYTPQSRPYAVLGRVATAFGQLE